MSYTLYAFHDAGANVPPIAKHDTAAWTLTGIPATHWSGRPGWKFTIPANTPNVNGMSITIGPIFWQHGILYIKDGSRPWGFQDQDDAAFQADDFHVPSPNLPRLVANHEAHGVFLAQDV